MKLQTHQHWFTAPQAFSPVCTHVCSEDMLSAELPPATISLALVKMLLSFGATLLKISGVLSLVDIGVEKGKLF
jgi:hypothetical protein